MRVYILTVRFTAQTETQLGDEGTSEAPEGVTKCSQTRREEDTACFVQPCNDNATDHRFAHDRG